MNDIVINYIDDIFDLDNYFIPILKHLWRTNVVTYFSCSGHEKDWSSCYLVFKYNRKFINYLWKNHLALEKTYNSIDKHYQYIVRIDYHRSYSEKIDNRIKDKLRRDHLLSILANYDRKI